MEAFPFAECVDRCPKHMDSDNKNSGMFRDLCLEVQLYPTTLVPTPVTLIFDGLMETKISLDIKI